MSNFQKRRRKNSEMFHFCQTPTHPMQKFCRFSKGKLRKSVLFILYYPCLVRYNSFPWSRTIRPAPSGPIWSFTCSRTNRAAWSSSGTRAPHSSYPAAPHKLECFGLIAECICLTCKMYLSNFPMYLSILQNVTVQPHPARGRRIPHILLHRTN